MGTYRVPNSQVLVSGFQKGSALAIALGSVGGTAGIALTSAAFGVATDSSGGKNAVQSDEAALQVSLASPATRILHTLLKRPEFGEFSLNANPAAYALKIRGDVVLQFFDNGDVRPFVVLNANLLSPHHESLWTTRYVASLGAPRPLSGDPSWTTPAGTLNETVSAELQRALLVMLTDVSSPYPRNKNDRIAVQGYFPFIKKRIQVVGLRLADAGDWFAFSPNVPVTSSLSGVNIMDKSVAQFRVAKSNDPRLKVIATP